MVESGRGSLNILLGGLTSLNTRANGSRILDDLALPGDGGGIDFGVDIVAAWECGELCGFLSSPPPKIDNIDMPPAGRCEENDARSRKPAKGDAVGGPRGAEPGRDEALEGSCGGDGGGICRDMNGNGGAGGSNDAAMFISLPCHTADDQDDSP